ncbi:hypothetical protein [Amycolatopsis sp. NPDC051903]|uniref:hypothetical protein n=1 Tax=Amycolatopsis sp. NPDC051903 TaxID=3363936 RepID=UPI0037957F64
MDTRRLRYFVVVVDHGTVSKPRRRCAWDNRRCPRRSARWNEALFHRIRRRLVLTEAGEALIEPARQVVRGLDHARERRFGRRAASGADRDRGEAGADRRPLPRLIKAVTDAHPGLSVPVRAAFTADGRNWG